MCKNLRLGRACPDPGAPAAPHAGPDGLDLGEDSGAHLGHAPEHERRIRPPRHWSSISRHRLDRRAKPRRPAAEIIEWASWTMASRDPASRAEVSKCRSCCARRSSSRSVFSGPRSDRMLSKVLRSRLGSGPAPPGLGGALRRPAGDRGIELLPLEGLRHMAVHAGIEEGAHLLRQHARRHRDDRHRVGRMVQRPDAARRRHAVHDGHLDVHQHHVVVAGLHRRHGLGPVRHHVDAMPGRFEHRPGDLLVDHVVLDQEDVPSRGAGRRGSEGDCRVRHAEFINLRGATRRAGRCVSDYKPLRIASVSRAERPMPAIAPQGRRPVGPGREAPPPEPHRRRLPSRLAGRDPAARRQLSSQGQRCPWTAAPPARTR